jgi:HAD superfamily hydrolase (TIGR01459 family)
MTHQVFTNLSSIADRYDGFIVDLWGVIHDGINLYPGVDEAIDRLMQAGKRVVLLSNAPRQIASIAGRLIEYGLAPDRYTALMTSGEEAWQCLNKRTDPWYQNLGDRVYHIGSVRDDGMRVGINAERVMNVREASFILCTGSDYGETLEQYMPLLAEARSLNLKFICANPDLIVVHGGKLEMCAGLLAQHYESLGGDVRWHGKPHRSVYETCFGLLGLSDHSRIVGVGDALRTDIAGAKGAGIDSLFVTGGIHGEALGVTMGQTPTQQALDILYEGSEFTPTNAITAFRW